MTNKLRDLAGLIILLSVAYVSLQGMASWIMQIMRKLFGYLLIICGFALKVIVLLCILNAFINPSAYSMMNIICLVGISIICSIGIYMGIDIIRE